MLRASLRSLADPVRGHVCISCRARRMGAPRMRQFHRMPALHDKHSNNKLEGSLKHTPASSSQEPDNKDSSNKDHASAGKESTSHVSTSTKESSSTKSARRRSRRRREATKKGASQPPQLKKQTNAPEATGNSEEKSTESSASEKVDTNDKRSISKVKELLEASAQKPRRSKQSDEKSKISHIASFIKQKTTGTLESGPGKIKALDIPTATVPGLSFGLERVLFNPGVYQLRDPRSRVYNFDPYLGSIMPVNEFDFDTLKGYITSSKDDLLRSIAAKENKKYVGSSSSMTSVLSHFHYLLSGWRGVDTRTLSQGFPEKMRTFTRLLRAPAAMFLHYQDGVYAIDADKEFDSANILMNLGKSMEKLLTLPKEDFERYRRSSENKISQEEEEAIPEAYHYSTMGDFIMRSQLDAYDPRLPGTGMFDLKTRAVVSIRMDAKNFEHGLGYEIKSRFGTFESYEREYYDMIRAAFLKYSLQVRIGRMDGIFVAFHNIERIFGFQYVSLPEMDQSLHGQSDTALGDTEFQLSLEMWNQVLNIVTEKYPKQSLRFHFETRDAVTPFMYVFAEPVTKDEIHAIQTRNAAEIEAYQQRLLNLTPKDDNSDLEAAASPAAEAEVESLASPSATEIGEEQTPINGSSGLIGFAITIRNKVNGKNVDRPVDFKATDKWTVDYEINEMSPTQTHSLYKMCQARRQKEFEGRGEDEQDVAANVYIRRLRELSQEGREHRKRENAMDQKKGIVVMDGAVN